MAIDNLKGLAHVGFYVKDIEVSKKFYCDILGFEVIFERSELLEEGGEAKVSFLKLGDMIFEMICIPNLSYPADGCFQHLAFRVINIEEAQKKLQEAGIKTDELVYSRVTFPNGS